MDECAVTDWCLGGHCVNSEGSFSCLCETGFQPSPDSGECVGKGSLLGDRALPHIFPPPPLPGARLPGTGNCSFREAGPLPYINHPVDNAFTEPLLTQGLCKDDKMKAIMILASRAHNVVSKVKLIQETFIKDLLGLMSFTRTNRQLRAILKSSEGDGYEDNSL